MQLDCGVTVEGADWSKQQSTAKTKAAAAVPEPIDSTEACEYKLIGKIKKANECNLHPGEVHIVVGGGEHITPTAADYAIWAHLVVRLLTQHNYTYHSNSLISNSVTKSCHD
jgi:hypothetical protein